jgi:hypothetical protein
MALRMRDFFKQFLAHQGRKGINRSFVGHGHVVAKTKLGKDIRFFIQLILPGLSGIKKTKVGTIA